jgi:hypothetical protein
VRTPRAATVRGSTGHLWLGRLAVGQMVDDFQRRMRDLLTGWDDRGDRTVQIASDPMGGAGVA